MGWLYSTAWPSSADMRNHLRDELSTSGYKIVKDALVAYGHRYYAATEKGGKTNIFVALISSDRTHGFGYKDMDESMGPNEVDCPLSVLNAASPVEALYDAGSNSLEWATKWRASVRAYHSTRKASRDTAKTLAYGDKVWIRNAAGNPYRVISVGKATKKVHAVDALNQGYYRVPVNRIERVEKAEPSSL